MSYLRASRVKSYTATVVVVLHYTVAPIAEVSPDLVTAPSPASDERFNRDSVIVNVHTC